MSYINEKKCDVCGNVIANEDKNAVAFEISITRRYPMAGGCFSAFRDKIYFHACGNCIEKLPEKWKQLFNIGREI